MLLGIDLGATNIRVGRVHEGAFEALHEAPIEQTDDPNTLVQQMASLIELCWHPTIHSIGIGVPSVVDVERGIVYDVQNIPSWKKVHLKDIMEVRFSVPTWVEIRYAEVLLNLAEAVGEGAEGYGYINQVRARAGLAAIDGTTPGSYDDKLLQERRVELAFENKRWPDLLRHGKAKSVMASHLGIGEGSVTLLFPIPQSQIDVAPDEMSQNAEH